MSVRAFERKFRGSFHLTPQKYLRNLQMRMASRLLVYTGQSLAEVALGCGFSDQSHFTREFRRHFGRTPRDYREHYARGPDCRHDRCDRNLPGYRPRFKPRALPKMKYGWTFCVGVHQFVGKNDRLALTPAVRRPTIMKSVNNMNCLNRSNSFQAKKTIVRQSSFGHCPTPVSPFSRRLVSMSDELKALLERFGIIR